MTADANVGTTIFRHFLDLGGYKSVETLQQKERGNRQEEHRTSLYILVRDAFPRKIKT